MKRIMFNSGAYSGTVEHFGSLRALIERNCITNKQKFYGISAGACIALIAFLYANNKITNSDIDDIYANFISCMGNSSYTDPTSFIFAIIEYMIQYAYPDLYKEVSKHFFVGITTRKGFKWCTKFKSNYDFFHIMICSCNLSCLSTYTPTCLDGYYSYNPYVHLPRHTIIIHTSYHPPICLIPIKHHLIIQNLFQSGYNKTIIEMKRYENCGTEKLTYIDIYDYLFWFKLHERYCKLNPEWDVKLKRLFNYNSGR